MAATVLALFAGYGGLEIATDAAWPGGTRAVGYVEREGYPAAILLARMEEQTLEPAPVFAGNIEDLDTAAFHGVDIVTAGFPCQPFSAAGKRHGQSDERWLWDDIVRILREIQPRPRWIVLENVPGLVRLGLGPVLGGLAELGYDAEWGLLSASAVGAAHKRERWFCLARRRDGVDDTSGGRHGNADAEVRAGRDAADDAGGELADAELARRTPTRGGSLVYAGGQPEPGICELADAERGGREGGLLQRTGKGAEQFAAFSRPLFAPGPADLDVWAGLLAETPQAQPSLCRDADGSARWLEYRKDRLRALGNGVVPLQAAAAIRALAARAGWRLE